MAVDTKGGVEGLGCRRVSEDMGELPSSIRGIDKIHWQTKQDRHICTVEYSNTDTFGHS